MAARRSVLRSNVLAPVGVVVLVAALAACSTSPGGGGGGGCTTPTAIHSGVPATTPAQGWYTDDTRSEGTVAVDDSFGAPSGFGCNAVVLTTGPDVGQDKAQLFTFAKAGTTLASVTNLSYWAYRAAPVGAAADLALNVEIYGFAGFAPGCGKTPPSTSACFATLTYEPYQQPAGQTAIVDNKWQHWDATNGGSGLWWTTKIASGPGSQAQPASWQWFKSTFSDAVLGGYGFNIGSYNPNMVVAGDGLTFNNATTNF
jgi:hypothetical protein